MKKYLFILSTLILLAFASCNKFLLSDIIETNEYSIEGTYTELQVADAFDVTVSDTATRLIVYADQNVMPYVVVEKSSDKLKIYLKPITFNTGDLKAVLPYNPDLKKVELSGASELHSEFVLEGDKVEVDLSGASDFFGDIVAGEIEMDLSGSSNIEGNVTAAELDLKMSGASEATLAGQVTTLNINLSGSSEIKKTVVNNRYGLACEQCKGLMTGASSAYIHCDGTIKVSLSGSSDLHFTGSAFTGDSDTSGASDIIHDTL